MEDISDATAVATSTPEDAANNISNGNLFDVDPGYAAQNKSTFDASAAPLLAPQQAEPPVADYMRQSTEHAALAVPDVDHLSFMARQTKMISDYLFDRPTTQQNIVDLNLKKMNNGGKLEPDDEIALMSANQDAADQQNQNYGFTGPVASVEKFGLDMAGNIGQSAVRAVRDTIFKDHALSPGRFLGDIALRTFVKQPYDALTAGTYNELSNLTDANGQPKNLDEDTKQTFAKGVGVIGTTLMAGAGLAVGESAPFLRPLMNPVLASGLINTPVKAAAIIAIGNAAKGIAANAGASGLTEISKIIATEMGKNQGTDEAGFWNSISTAATKANASRVGDATVQGAAQGLAMELPIQALGFNGTRQAFQDRLDFAMANQPPKPGPRDVTPQEPAQVTGSGPKVDDGVIDLEPNDGSGGSPIEKSIKALQMNEALHNVNDVQNATNMKDVAPGELNEVNKRNFAAAGMDKMYATLDDLKEWATSDEKGRKARMLIDPSGVAAGQMNAPVELQSHDVMEIAKDYPDILDHVSAAPDMPTALTAKEHIEAIQRAEGARGDLMTKLGIEPKDVQPDEPITNVADLQPNRTPAVQPVQDFMGDVKRTNEILEQKKDIDRAKVNPVATPTDGTISMQDVASRKFTNMSTNTLKSVASAPEGVVQADEKEAAQHELDKRAKLHEPLDKELEKIKGRVTEGLKQNQPGSALAFPYDEPKAAIKAELKYGHAPTFTEAIQKVLPPEAAAKYNEAQFKARVNYTEMVHDAAVHEMNKVVDQHIAMGQEDARRAEMERIAHDPNYSLVDQFHAHQIGNAKGKAKRSIYAVDPSSLPDNLLKYTDNAQLKAHKFFAKGANTLEDAANAMGFESGKDMLDLFSRTPTREQVIKARSEFYNSDIEKMAKAGVDLDHTNIMKAFTERTRAHLEEMKFMREQEWPSAKFGIKKIALPLPRMEDIENESRAAVLQTKVGSLSPAQYVIAERQSQKIAIHSILNNEVEKAFQNKENAARASEMQRQTRMAIAEVNRAQKFFRRLQDPTAKEVMRSAGASYEKALNEITDVFNFNPKMKNQSEQNSFNKWARREVEAGRGDFSIPKRLSDVRQSINDMTVEQVSVAYDRAKTVFSEAKYKNELIENRDLKDDERSIDRIAQSVQNLSEVHPNFGKGNIPPVQDTAKFFEAVKFQLMSAETAFTNMEHTLRYYDQGKMNGWFQKTFMHQLKGDGAFDGKMGFSNESLRMQKFADQARKIMDNHGDYNKVEKKILNIPEFKDHAGLNYGQLTKGDLMTAWAYKGDPNGRAMLQANFKDSNGKSIALQTWQKVFDRELEPRDVAAMQYAVDMYKGYQADTQDLQNRTKGEDVKFIQGVSNEHRGQFYPGGYVPTKFRIDFTAEAAKRAIQMLENKRATFYEGDDGAEYGRQYAAEQTEQGRLIQREGSEKPLDLSLMRFWRGHEEVIHDLAYREPTMNILKILRDKRIRESMVQMGGQARYNLLTNTVIEMAGRAEAMNSNYFADQNNFIKSMFGRLQQNFNVVSLGVNLTSTLVQYEELTQLLQNMGPSGVKHFGMVAAKMTATPHLWGAYHDFAAELDPTIANAGAQIQNKITSTVHDIIPKKGETPIGAMNKWMANKMMAPMAFADVHDKVIGAMAGYSQFMSGDAENWPIEKVQALDETARHQAAQAYVRQLSRLSLMHGRPEDRTPSQKNPMAGFFSNYWNFFRNVLNNQINVGRRATWATRSGISSVRAGLAAGGSGDGGGNGGNGPGRSVDEMRNGKGGGDGSSAGSNFKDAAGHFGSAASMVAFATIIATMGRWYSSKLRGKDDTPDKWEGLDLKSAKGIADASERMGSYMLMSPIDQGLGAMPFVRDVTYAANQPDKVIRGLVDKEKVVQIPIIKQLSELATGINSLRESAQTARNLSEFLHIISNLDNKETRALLDDTAYFGIPWPVNAYSKIMRVLELPLNQPTDIPQTAYNKLHKEIMSYNLNPNKEVTSPEFHAQLEDINQKIAPKAVTIPDGMSDVMKYANSGADWSKPDGIMGFSKDQWNQIKTAEPGLALTDAGRIAKNTNQQERAMDYFLHDTAQTLTAKDVTVDKAALLGSFKLGVDKYADLAKAPNDTKVKTVLSSDDLAKNPELSQFKTVGQVKNYFNNQSAEASKHAMSPAPQLTSADNKVED